LRMILRLLADSSQAIIVPPENNEAASTSGPRAKSRERPGSILQYEAEMFIFQTMFQRGHCFILILHPALRLLHMEPHHPQMQAHSRSQVVRVWSVVIITLLPIDDVCGARKKLG
jgi:hypothetical protein